MNTAFVIADTHFGHRAVINFEHAFRPFNTIEEHDEALVENWNKTVKKHDTVIHLGDVLFGADSFKYLHRLNGIKKLVMGNHDRYPIRKYLNFFSTVMGCYEWHDCILTHVPVHPCQFERYRLNVHGHTHSGVVLSEFGEPHTQYVCASVEHTNLKPVALEEITKGRG